MTSSDWNVSAAPRFHDTTVLPFSELIKFEIAKILFNCNDDCLSPSCDHHFTSAKNFHSRVTTFPFHKQMVIPLHKTNRIQKSIKYVD